jgi:hypothetical protein
MKLPPQINVSSQKVFAGLESSLDFQPVEGADIGAEDAPRGTRYAVSSNGVTFLRSPDGSVMTDLSPGWLTRLTEPFPRMRPIELEEEK